MYPNLFVLNVLFVNYDIKILDLQFQEEFDFDFDFDLMFTNSDPKIEVL